MILDRWTTRGRGFGAAVTAVVGVLLLLPSVATAGFSLSVSPASPRVGQAVTISPSGACDGLCSHWRMWVNDRQIAGEDGKPDPVTDGPYTTPGEYTARLRVDSIGFPIPIPSSRDTYKTFTVSANRAPIASFTASSSTPVPGQAVTLTDTSTDPDSDPLTRAWDTDGDGVFDDGTGTTAAVTFASPGAKVVRLRVRDSFGATSEAAKTLTVVNSAPTAALTVTPTTVTTGAPVSLSVTASDPDGGALTYAWDLDGDGAFDDAATATVPAQTFARAGTRTLGVRVTDDDGDAGTSTVQRTAAVTVTNRLPSEPTITSDPPTVTRGQTLKLTAAATDPEGTSLTYAWDFDDDAAYDDATGAQITRTMPASGALFARVQVTDADGGTSISARFTLTADNRSPTAAFTVSNDTPTIGQAVTFTDTSSDPDGQPLTRAWDLDGDNAFDDGGGATATATYPTRGARTVRLRVSDGLTAVTATRTVTVRNLTPTATLSVTPGTALTAVAITFGVAAADPDGGALTYAWDLDGDGAYNDSTVATPATRSYPRSGARTIGVRVTDDDGDPATSTVQQTTTLTIQNRAPSAPAITATPSSVQRGESVELTAAASDPEGTAIAYAWDTDSDGAYDDGAGAAFTRTMPASGSFTVRVRATDADGGSSVSAPFTLTAGNRPPTAALTIAPATVSTGAPVSLTVTANDPDNQTLTYAWDLDGDGAFDDATTATVPAQSFPRAGARTLGVRVTDSQGSSVQKTGAVTVTNQLPSTPSITPVTLTPAAGQPFELRASATDPEGTALVYTWDTDGDGAYDDASGALATVTFPATGTTAIRVRATDADGGSATSDALTLTAPPADPGTPPANPDAPAAPGTPFVSSDPPAPAGSKPSTSGASSPTAAKNAKATLMRPFPRIRIKGRLTRRGAKFTGITVSAPAGSRVEATCDGGGCPRKKIVQTTGRRGVVQLKGLLGSLRSGARIVIRVTRAGRIGKHTEILVRKGRAPKRTDLCLRPESTAPTRCPAN